MTNILTTEYYENIVNTRNITHATIIKALSIVKQFIVKHNLILVGSMAIEGAIRLKGGSLFPIDQLPDYDFYSPYHANHAYELSRILCLEKFHNVSCIQATHITTMRVRVDYEVVADITYCPESIYEIVPTLNYDSMRIVHPHFQMIDQHRALSLPFENPGREVIFHRWKKDAQRYDILYGYYPVVPEIQEFVGSTLSDVGTTLVLSEKKSKYNISKRIKDRGYIRPISREMKSRKLEIPLVAVYVDMKNIRNSCVCGWGGADYKIEKNKLGLSIPHGQPVSVASDDIKEFISDNKLTNVEYYSEYFGKLPRYILATHAKIDRKIQVFDTYGIKLSARKLSEEHNVYMCSIQWVMLFMLVQIFSNPSKKIIFTAEEQYLRCRQLVASGDYPIIEVYGKHNLSLAFLNKIKKDKEMTYRIRAPRLQPMNMKPKLPGCINDKTFDPKTSPYFEVDGAKVNGFIEWTDNPYPEYTKHSVASKGKYSLAK
jgi:hypothetical protein